MTPPLGIALTLAAGFSLACSNQELERPNVVLISIDSLRADHLGCYGYPRATSPTIDRLAREGVRFESAVSTTSWTLPAHAALFTGLYDSAHGVVDNGLALANEKRTLAEVLRDAGYDTAGFFGGPYLHPIFGLAQGFATYTSCMAGIDDTNVEAQSRARESVSHKDVTGPRTAEALERWLEAGPEAPFFLFVHLWDVHYDYLPPAEYVQAFDPDYAGSVSGERYMQNAAVRRDMDERDLQHVVALYDGEIRFTDDVLGRILEALRARGKLENTLIVVTADHGEEFFEHGYKGHQRTLYDEVVKVPLIFHWPGKLAPRVVRDQVRLVDVMPTVLTLAGVRSQPRVQGRDLTPLLLGERLPAEPALCELLVDQGDLRALRTSEVKLLMQTLRDGHKSTLGFDLSLDPLERHPLPADSERVRTGVKELEALVGETREFRRADAREIEVDEEMLRRLHQLGYIDGKQKTKE